MEMVRLGVAVLVALSVAGCGGGSEESAPRTVGGPTLPSVPSTVAGSAGPMSSAPGSSGSSPSSTPAGPPVLPAVGKTNTKAGAEAFARWYLESMNYSGMHPAVKLPPVAQPGCKSCANFQGHLDRLAAAGERYSGNSLVLGEVTAPDFVPGGADVRVAMDQPSIPIVNASGETVRMSDEGGGAFWPTLVWAGGSWKVAGVRVEHA